MRYVGSFEVPLLGNEQKTANKAASETVNSLAKICSHVSPKKQKRSACFTKPISLQQIENQ